MTTTNAAVKNASIEHQCHQHTQDWSDTRLDEQYAGAEIFLNLPEFGMVAEWGMISHFDGSAQEVTVSTEMSGYSMGTVDYDGFLDGRIQFR